MKYVNTEKTFENHCLFSFVGMLYVKICVELKQNAYNKSDNLQLTLNIV